MGRNPCLCRCSSYPKIKGRNGEYVYCFFCFPGSKNIRCNFIDQETNEQCKKVAKNSYGHRQPRHCKNHMKKSTTKICQHIYQNGKQCTDLGSFGYYYSKGDRCKQHKGDPDPLGNHIESRRKQYTICKKKGCIKKSNFNFAGQRKKKFCRTCREPEMVIFELRV